MGNSHAKSKSISSGDNSTNSTTLVISRSGDKKHGICWTNKFNELDLHPDCKRYKSRTVGTFYITNPNGTAKQCAQLKLTAIRKNYPKTYTMAKKLYECKVAYVFRDGVLCCNTANFDDFTTGIVAYKMPPEYKELEETFLQEAEDNKIAKSNIENTRKATLLTLVGAAGSGNTAKASNADDTSTADLQTTPSAPELEDVEIEGYSSNTLSGLHIPGGI
jgi:hypothetical protein